MIRLMEHLPCLMIPLHLPTTLQLHLQATLLLLQATLLLWINIRPIMFLQKKIRYISGALQTKNTNLTIKYKVHLTAEQLEIYPRLIQLKEELRELQRAELDLRSVIASGEQNYNVISQNNVAGYV